MMPRSSNPIECRSSDRQQQQQPSSRHGKHTARTPTPSPRAKQHASPIPVRARSHPLPPWLYLFIARFILQKCMFTCICSACCISQHGSPYPYMACCGACTRGTDTAAIALSVGSALQAMQSIRNHRRRPKTMDPDQTYRPSSCMGGSLW